MMSNNACAKAIMLYLNHALRKQEAVSFNDVMGAPQCKKYSVRDIGKTLEELRRSGLVKAKSRFGCSELLEFTATEITEKGKEFISEFC